MSVSETVEFVDYKLAVMLYLLGNYKYDHYKV